MAEHKSYGTQFQIGDDDLSGTPAYTTVAQVQSQGEFGLENEMADVTAHDSPGGYREAIANGITAQDDLELTLFFDIAQATHANSAGGLMHAMLNRTKLAYRIIYPDTSGTTWTFEGFVMNFSIPVDQGEDSLMANVTMKITGQPTLS